MKRLVLGDMHGHYETVKQIYDKECPEQVILLGDYFDSFTVTPLEQKDSFESLMELKNLHELQYGDNTFILLLGNHDFHYFESINERYSGFRFETFMYAQAMVKAFDDKQIQIAVVDNENKTIYSHAGVTNTWFKGSSLTTILDLNNVNFNKLKHTYLGGDFTHIAAYGDTIYNGPLWVRPQSLREDAFIDNSGVTWKQIVGHTHYKTIQQYDGIITVMDSLPYQYLVEELDAEGKKLAEKIVSL